MRAFIEDVANSLSRFRSFVVYSTQSTFSLNSKNKISGLSELNQDYTIDSTSLPGSPGVSFRLSDEQTGRIAWSAEYRMDLGNLPYAFGYLAKHIAQSLGDEIERVQAEKIRSCDSGEGYVSFLQGKSLLQQTNLPAVRRAKKAFNKAKRVDARLVGTDCASWPGAQLEWLLLGRPEPDLLVHSKDMADKAIRFDPFDATGHWMAAVVALYQRDYDTSEQRFREAESLAPNNADLILQYADAISHYGDKAVAWQLFKRATSINPLAPDRHWWAGAGIAFSRGDYAGAVDLCERMIDPDPALRVYTF